MIIIKYIFIENNKIIISILRNDREFTFMQTENSPSIKRLSKFIKESKNWYTPSVRVYSELVLVFLAPRD